MTPRHPFAVAVVELVASAYGIDPELIWGGERLGPTITEARWISWVHAKRMCGWSNVETGYAFCIDSTCVLYALRKLSARVQGGTCTPWYSSAAQALDKLSVSTWQAVKCGVSGTVASAEPRALSPSGSDSVLSSASLLSSDPRPVSKPAREPKAKVTRWRFVPADWAPNEAHRKLALEQRVSLDDEVKKFRDHEFKEPKSDADRAFNRWLRMAGNGMGWTAGKPPGQGSHGEGGQSAPRRPELRPLLPPRPVQEATPLEVAAHLGQVLNRPAAPRTEQRGRMSAAELDRAVDEMTAGRGR
jgi:hypothetical protein